MTGNKLKEFVEHLPDDEKEAINALCKPDWNQEIYGIKKEPEGIMMLVMFIDSPHDTMPIYNGAIQWLHDHKHFPKDQELIKKYKQYPTLYLDEMKPYAWRCRIMWGKEDNPCKFLHMWLMDHDPENVYLTHNKWLERDQVLKDLKSINEYYRFPDHFFDVEFKKTQESMSGFQEEQKLINDKSAEL